MKLSDGIELGSTIVTPVPGIIVTPERVSGCAIGMAVIACGGGFRESTAEEIKSDRRTSGTESIWPWTLQVMRRPCHCFFIPRRMPAKTIVAHLFDKHVFGKRNWTIDDLVAWVRSVEPEDVVPEPELVAIQGVAAESQP